MEEYADIVTLNLLPQADVSVQDFEDGRRLLKRKCLIKLSCLVVCSLQSI